MRSAPTRKPRVRNARRHASTCVLLLSMSVPSTSRMIASKAIVVSQATVGLGFDARQKVCIDNFSGGRTTPMQQKWDPQVRSRFAMSQKQQDYQSLDQASSAGRIVRQEMLRSWDFLAPNLSGTASDHPTVDPA